MLSVITFKWHTPGYRAKFTASHVNTLRRMVAANYTDPHRFVCITDDAEGLDSGIEAVPLWDDLASVPNPTAGGRPSCYRRLKLFAPGMEAITGPRFVMLDLDALILGDLRPLWNRTEDAVFWRSPSNEWPYNGAMFMANAGARPQVWTDFDPIQSPKATMERGYRGSDQAWLSHVLGPDEATWDYRDGVWYWGQMKDRTKPPQGARVIFTTAGDPPWNSQQAWMREDYFAYGHHPDL